MKILSSLIFFSGLAVLFFNFLVYFKDRKSSVNLSFALFGFAISSWLFTYGLAYLKTDLNIKLYLFRLGYIGVILIPFTFLNFVSNLLEFRGKNVQIIRLFFVVLLLCLIAINFSEPGFLSYLLKYKWGYYPAATPILHPILLFFFTTIFAIANSLLFMGAYANFFTFNLTQRVRLKYVFAGSLIGVLGSFDFSGSYNLPFFYPIGFIFMIPYPIILGYAIIKHRLMQINLAITKTTIFTAVYSLVLGVPFALAFGWRENLIKLLGLNWWIIPLLASTFLATLGPFIYLYIDKKAENKLLKEQRAYQNILRSASGGMIRIKDLSRLLNLVVHVITKTVKIKHASIYLLDTENNKYILHASRGIGKEIEKGFFIDTGSPLVWQLTSNQAPVVTEEIVMKMQDEPYSPALSRLIEQLIAIKAALVVPSFVEDKLIGLLVLGEKLSRKLYSQDDLNVFSVLANQAALAIENAQFYDEVKRTHEQLFQAEKLATIGTMADGLSHQINNRFHALSLIAGDSLDILKNVDVSLCSGETREVMNELKNSLEKIQNNVLQGGEIVKGLLKYSRPGDSGFEAIDFKDVFKGALDMVQYKIKLNEIDLIQNFSDALPKIYGNLAQLQEVFFNLIDNAYDAIKERQSLLKEKSYRGKIELMTACVNGSLEITLVDNGIGIKDADKKKLFAPFFTTKATSRKGTGLGLYVIEKIIGSHNGKINISSTYQSGTRFVITLPSNQKI